MRLVSLVPSLSRTLCDLGLRDAIVGCTSFCISPPDLHKTARVVGGTKDTSLEAVAQLNPTHILVNDEENTPEIISGCQSIARTLTSSPVKPEDSALLLRTLGKELGCEQTATTIADRLDAQLDQIKCYLSEDSKNTERARFLYLIWREPYMAAGSNTYLSHAVELLGWRNVLTGSKRYPQLSVDEIACLNAGKFIFTSEPYPFRKRHIERFSKETGIDKPFFKADGQLFTWWGSLAEELFQEILNYHEKRSTRLIAPVLMD